MGDTTDRDPSSEQIYDGIGVIEPYTAGELASDFDVPKERVRNLLERLVDSGKNRKKVPESERAIWVRKAPAHECDECGYRYEIKVLHPLLSSVQVGPRCGNQLS